MLNAIIRFSLHHRLLVAALALIVLGLASVALIVYVAWRASKAVLRAASAPSAAPWMGGWPTSPPTAAVRSSGSGRCGGGAAGW